MFLFRGFGRVSVSWQACRSWIPCVSQEKTVYFNRCCKPVLNLRRGGVCGSFLVGAGRILTSVGLAKFPTPPSLHETVDFLLTHCRSGTVTKWPQRWRSEILSWCLGCGPETTQYCRFRGKLRGRSGARFQNLLRVSGVPWYTLCPRAESGTTERTHLFTGGSVFFVHSLCFIPFCV